MDTKPTLTIRYATLADSERLTDFRVSQFRTAKEFQILNLDSLAIQRGKVFIVELDDEIISTMQIEVISLFTELTKLTHTYIPKDFSFFDTIYLSKGATLKDFRNTGLNSYLRRITIQNALNNSTINSLTGIAYENAPRLHLLEKIGYIFTEVKLIDSNYTTPKGKVFFLTLERNKFQVANERLTSETKDIETNFEIINQTQ